MLKFFSHHGTRNNHTSFHTPRLADMVSLSITRVPTHVEKQAPYTPWAGAYNGTATLEGNQAAFGEFKDSCFLHLDPFKAKGNDICSPPLGYMVSTGQCPVLVIRPTTSHVRRITVCSDHSPVALGYFNKTFFFSFS